ncbi:MAG TPA: ROK family protein [Draconibacterium sp.]|nr:ROK family protein [Draconibacterium sp.]
MIDKIAMGIDIGGSHITCQLFNISTNRLIELTKARMPVDGNGSKETILDSWTKAIQQTASNQKIKDLIGIGFAMPGPFDYLNGIAWFDENVDKFRHLTGVDVKAELIQRLELPAGFPIRFLNDASSFAVGEANVEPVSKHRRIIALTLGTGFGTTFIKDNLPVAGKGGIPKDGFLYHIPFQESIADEYFSTRWFLNEYKKQTGKVISGVKELVKLADKDSTARKLFYDFGLNLGNFLIPWIQKFKADCIVIGGNISKSYPLFKDEMNGQFQKEGFEITVHISELDENAALIGSARLCDDIFYNELIETKIIR